MGMGRVWEKFELGRAPILEKCVLTSLASKNPKMYAHSSMHPHFSLPRVFGTLLHSPFTVLQCSSFFPWLGSGFVNVQWLGSLLGIFMIVSTFPQLGISCFQCCKDNGV